MLLAEGFTPPSSGGTISGDQPENCAPESPKTDSVDSKTDSTSHKYRRRRAALHVRNEADGVVPNEALRKDQQPATQQRADAPRPHQDVASSHRNTPGMSRASATHLRLGLRLHVRVENAIGISMDHHLCRHSNSVLHTLRYRQR